MKKLIIIFICLISFGLNAEERPPFQGKYIYSDGSERFRSPSVPESDEDLIVRIQVRKGMADRVLLHLDGQIQELAAGTDDGFYQIYACHIAGMDQARSYYFEIIRADKRVFYSRRGLEMSPPPGNVRFKIQPGFAVPDWAEGAVLYQIFTDRFYNGEPGNDVLTNEYLYDNYPAVAREWGDYPDSSRTYAHGSDRTREFYGGDLQGIIQKLDYLESLGVEGIYLNPIFVSPSNHKYDTQDYNHIDPHFAVILEDDGELIEPEDDPNYGSDDFNSASAVNAQASLYIQRTTNPVNLEASDQLFKTLIHEAHARGIKVILDGVFNHAGSFNKWFDREHLYKENGAYESLSSPWSDWFSFSDNQGWPDNESYEAWYGFKTLPKLNLEGNPEAEAAILEAAARWVGPEFGADGWRLDVAAELGHSPEYNHEFWAKFRQAVKSANPDAIILAEVYGNSSPWLEGDEWDSIMNYDAFFDPVSWFLTGMEKHSWSRDDAALNDSDRFMRTLNDKMARLPWNSLLSAMNELSNHDHSRFLTRSSGQVDEFKQSKDISNPELASKGINKGIMKEAVLMQLFMPGAPTIYYGEEAGLSGFTDPDCRRTYPWGEEDEELMSFYQDALDLRQTLSSPRDGSFMILPTARKGIFSFVRWNQDDLVLVVVNNKAEETDLSLDLDTAGIQNGDQLQFLLMSRKGSHSLSGDDLTVQGRSVYLEIPAFGALVYSMDVQDRKMADPEAPQVEEIRKAKEQIPGSISIRFSQQMDQRSILDAFRMSPVRYGRFYWNGNTVTFIPSTALEPGEYTVHIDDALRSRKGSFPLDKEYSWSFKVK